MLEGLLTLIAFQLVGEIVVRVIGVPVPGPVAGMALLLGALALRGGVPASLERTARGLLQHLALLFVPVGVGVMALGPMVADDWPAIAFTLVATTIVTLLVTALITARLVRGHRARANGTVDRHAPASTVVEASRG
jgi:holin-like protein